MDLAILALDWLDVVDVLVVALALWAFLVWVRRSRARYAPLVHRDPGV